MTPSPQHRSLIPLALLTVTGLHASPATAGVAVAVEYLNFPRGETARLREALSGPARQAVVERGERREIYAWYHYRVRFPLGSAREYSDVVVTVWADFARVEDPSSSAAYEHWIHDTEIYQPVPGVRSEGSFADFPWDEDFGADLMATYPETFPVAFRGEGHTREENRRFDAMLMGRKTYQVGLDQGLTNPYPTLDQYVFSCSAELGRG